MLARAEALAIPSYFLFEALDGPDAPTNTLRHHPADHTASPNQLIGCEETPGLIAFDNTTRDELARNRRVVKPMASETTRQPQSAFNFANLRHAMDGAAERSVPQMCDAHLPQP